MDNTLVVESLDILKAMVELFPERSPEVREYIDIVNGLPHGCSCNRARRVHRAKELYSHIIQNLTNEQETIIKNKNPNQKIVFKLHDKVIHEI
jgi:hypothetical protein